jgi:drug/metabolite transporter (DMT)-like permease
MNQSRNGWIFGLIGVIIFSGSLPATRVAVADFDPLFLTVARAALAGLLAVATLVCLRQKRPDRTDIPSLVIVALGVVVGFPLFTALALQHITSARSIVFIALLPLATAIFGVMRAGERPHPAFWAFSLAGSAFVVGFALNEASSGALIGDAFMVAAIIVCGLGYAEGGRLSRTLGGWQVISWALVISLPLMLVLSLITFPDTLAGIGTSSWTALGYVSMFSMFIGFAFWYRGLAQGGVAAVSQLQLLQPFFGLLLAAGLLREEVSLIMAVVSVAVVACVAGAKRFSQSAIQTKKAGVPQRGHQPRS